MLAVVFAALLGAQTPEAVFYQSAEVVRASEVCAREHVQAVDMVRLRKDYEWYGMMAGRRADRIATEAILAVDRITPSEEWCRSIAKDYRKSELLEQTVEVSPTLSGSLLRSGFPPSR